MTLKQFCHLVNLIFCLTIGVCAQQSGEEETKTSLEFDFVRFIEPQHYDIHLIVSSTKQFRDYDGIVKIKFRSKTNSTLFRFISADSINITNVKLINLRTFVEASDFTLKRVKTNRSITYDAFVVSNIGENVIEQSEEYALEVRFHKYFDNRGFFASSYKVDNKTSYFAATHFQTKSIRHVIPTFEDVSFKVPIKLRITHHPKFTALSNMPGRVVAGDSNRVTTEFDETPPMSGYLLAFAIGKFKSKPVPNDRNLSFHIYGSSKIFTETDDATAISGKILLGLEDYFAIQYALPKMDYLIIPEFPFYGMENWGLVIFLESKIFGNWKTTKTADLVVNTVVNAHELAHQYFGNLVTPKEWRYVWLSEGFATFFSYYILDRVFPNDHYIDQFLVDNLFSTYDLDDYRSTLNPRAAKSSIFYVAEKINVFKASSIVRMIMSVIGENRFREGIKMYLRQHQYNSTVPTDLIRIFNTILRDDVSWPADIKIKSFIESWTHQSGTPILKVTRNYMNGDLVLKQKYNNKTNFYETRQSTWWIPYNYASKKNPDFNETAPIGWMENESMIAINLNLGPHDWVIFNKQYTSLYIVNYDERNWELLIDELLYGNHELIHEYNRAQLIHDLNRLVDYNQIDRKYLIKLLFYLKRETNYLPWAVADTILNELWKVLDKTKDSDMLKLAIRYMTDDTYDYYRLNAQQNEPKTTLLTRAIVIKWACKSGNQNCLQYFENLSAQYMNSIISLQPIFVHPDIKEILFCYGFQNETNYKLVFEYFLYNQNHPDASGFFEKFNCKFNTKLFRTYYHGCEHFIYGWAMFPVCTKLLPIMRNIQGNKIAIAYQCLLENCFDFRLFNKNAQLSDVVSDVLNPRYNYFADLQQIELYLAKVQELYGNASIKIINQHVDRYANF